MTEPAPIDVALQRRRLIIMAAIDAVCVVVALAAVAGAVGFNIRWLLWVFLAAVIAGFAAQAWLVLGLRPKR